VTALDPNTRVASTCFETAVAEFLEYLRVRNYAAGSITAYGHALGLLGRFLAERAVADPAEVTDTPMVVKWLFGWCWT
jgi:site-specific recombinase XerD